MGWSIKGAAKSELLGKQLDALTKVAIARAFAGATVTNVDWVHLFGLPHPDEMDKTQP
jgi:hypothetical protein